jgi:hypothetical protein
MKALLSALGLVALTLMLSGTAAAQCRITAQADSNTTLPAATIGKPYSATVKVAITTCGQAIALGYLKPRWLKNTDTTSKQDGVLKVTITLSGTPTANLDPANKKFKFTVGVGPLPKAGETRSIQSDVTFEGELRP